MQYWSLNKPGNILGLRTSAVLYYGQYKGYLNKSLVVVRVEQTD